MTARRLAGGLVAWVLIAGGCQWQEPKPAAESQYDPTRSTEIDVPPRQLQQMIQTKLAAAPFSMPIESISDGMLRTGWKEYPGAIHIVRRWQERTRFKITITPDFDEPAGKSHVTIIDESQEKPSAEQPWYPAPSLRRPERSEELLKSIQQFAMAASQPAAGR